jgi:hypothetical protein
LILLHEIIILVLRCMIQPKPKKRTIGRRELVDFPELKLREVEAKVDTGAYTSAIHCHQIREIVNSKGKCLRVELLDPSHPAYHNKKLTFRSYSLRDVRSSFGDVQERYVITTRIRLFGRSHEAEFTLSDRSDMRYPVLIGRTLLQGRFVVDVAKKNLSLRYKQRRQARREQNQQP